MTNIMKITTGHITQEFTDTGALVGQKFSASCDVEWEDPEGNPVDSRDSFYHPFDMAEQTGMGKATTSVLEEVCDDPSNPHGSLEVEVDSSQGSVDIKIQGHSQAYSANDSDWTITLELVDGRAILHVWADINQGDPTHLIDMTGALSVKRKKEINRASVDRP